MSENKLSSPRLRVQVETVPGQPYTEYVVQTDNRDMVRYDLLKSRKSWPAQREAPILFMTALAWCAIKRSGETTDDVETYLDKIVDIAAIGQDGEDLDPEDLEGEDGTAGPLA